jgi:hypothetical protein
MFYVEPRWIDKAWQDGAHKLTEALKRADGDITTEQLLDELRAGKKTLLGQSGGWAVVQVQSFHNRKVLHIDAIYAPGLTTPELFHDLKAFARYNGCDAIQGACQQASVRLWRRKFGFREAYTIMRYEL